MQKASSKRTFTSQQPRSPPVWSSTGGAEALPFRKIKELGHGNFGTVYLATVQSTGELVAIKEVLVDPRLGSRELAILRDVLGAGTPVDLALDANGNDSSQGRAQRVPAASGSRMTSSSSKATPGTRKPSSVGILPRHPCIIALHNHFFTEDAGTSRRYLNLVTSYLPSNLEQLKRHYGRPKAVQNSYFACDLSSLSSVVAGGKSNTTNNNNSNVAGAHFSSEPGLGDTTGGSGLKASTSRNTGDAGDAGSAAASASTSAGGFVARRVPLILAKVILFQTARALAFMHGRSVCHRDLKPANILTDAATGRVQLCDLGSAKQIVNQRREKNVSYICTRTYRAPELLFGALHYGCEVDLWSLGCIAAELLRDNAQPLFRGSSTVDQMAEIFKVLGAPSAAEMYAMNPQGAQAMLRTHEHYYGGSGGSGGGASSADISSAPSSSSPACGHVGSGGMRDCTAASVPLSAMGMPTSVASSAGGHSTCEHRKMDGGDEDGVSPYFTSPSTPAEWPFAAPCASRDYMDFYDILKIRAMPWSRAMPEGTSASAIDLVSQLLCYVPSKRLSAVSVVEHHFFDDLFEAASVEGEGRRDSHGSDEEVDVTARQQQQPLPPRLPSGNFLPVEMFMLTEDETRLYSEELQTKMRTQLNRILAALQRQQKE